MSNDTAGKNEALLFKLSDGFPPKIGATGLIEVFAPMRLTVKKNVRNLIDLGVSFDKNVLFIQDGEAKVVPANGKITAKFESSTGDLLIDEKQFVGYIVPLKIDSVLQEAK